MNILVITPIYPGPNFNNTKVVHYFAKEWQKMGENVLVVSVPSYFSSILYKMPKWSKNLLQRCLSMTIPIGRNNTVLNYTHENVPVIRVPLYKIHPWTKVRKAELNKAKKIIQEKLDEKSFTPDVIIAHWFDPSLYFVKELKDYFGCKAGVVIHNHTFRYSEYVGAVDFWGCRKYDTKNVVGKVFPNINISYRCASGIPSDFLKDRKIRDWKNIRKTIYVGTLIKRKYPLVALTALLKSRIGHSFNHTIIGDGEMRAKIQRFLKRDRLNDRVRLLGKIDRMQIISELDQSDVFIMISKDEIFGLVYLEAMARGLIVIGSKNEGMEGIIENGVNGFLVTAGSEDELTETINLICSLSPEERMEISKNAIKTACEYTDERVAKNYLDWIKLMK